MRSETKGKEMLKVAKVRQETIAVEFSWNYTDEDFITDRDIETCKKAILNEIGDSKIDFTMSVFAGYVLGGYQIVRIVVVFDAQISEERVIKTAVAYTEDAIRKATDKPLSVAYSYSI